MGQRIWTDEQLAEMSKRAIDKLFNAADKGETLKVKELALTMYDQFTHLHDGYMAWIAGLLTYLYEQGGSEEVEKAERFAHEKEGQLVFLPPEKTDFKFMVEKMAIELQGHVYQFMSLEEDDEKVVLTNRPCGSGGRLIKMGAYEPEIGMAKIKEPGNHPRGVLHTSGQNEAESLSGQTQNDAVTVPNLPKWRGRL